MHDSPVETGRGISHEGRWFEVGGWAHRFCFGRNLGWVTDPGTGVVNSWVKAHKAYFQGDSVPYIVVQITLDSGPQLTTSWTGTDDLVIGQSVIVSFRPVSKGDVTRWVPEFGPP